MKWIAIKVRRAFLRPYDWARMLPQQRESALSRAVLRMCRAIDERFWRADGSRWRRACE